MKLYLMSFKSYKDLAEDVVDWMKTLPKHDLVIGIPRSGMLPASILATAWHVPLATIVNDEVVLMSSGKRLKAPQEYKKVLLVDDSMFRGSAMKEAKKVQKYWGDTPLSTAVVYLAETEGERSNVDYYYEHVPQLRCFQWNWQHHKAVIERACFDIDGVLCRKPTPEENDDGEKYRHFILNTEPKYLPSGVIGCIVTSRLEKFRKETVAWLKKHNVEYDHLIMLNYPSGKFRRRMGHHGLHKAEWYKRSNAVLFVEDEIWQAKEIATRTGRPVLCVTDWRIYK